mgnify:CR=1 FL=1
MMIAKPQGDDETPGYLNSRKRTVIRQAPNPHCKGKNCDWGASVSQGKWNRHKGASPGRLTDKRRAAEGAAGCSASCVAVSHGKAHRARKKLQTRASHEPYPKAKAGQAGPHTHRQTAEQPRVCHEISRLSPGPAGLADPLEAVSLKKECEPQPKELNARRPKKDLNARRNLVGSLHVRRNLARPRVRQGLSEACTHVGT